MIPNFKDCEFISVTDLDLTQSSPSQSAILVDEGEPFFHYDPVFVGLVNPDLHQLSAAWNHCRTSHTTYFNSVDDAIIFGANYVGSLGNGDCYSESLGFRRGGYEFYDNVFKSYFQGDHPRVIYQGDSSVTVRWEKAQLADIICLDEPVVLITPFEPDNWARWLCHVIPRLLYVNEHSISLRPLVRASKAWQVRLLEIFGFGRDTYINHYPGTTYFSPSVSFFQQSAVDFTVTRREHSQFAKIARAFVPEKATPRRIFISRQSASKANPNYRRLINEEQLTTSLAELEFVQFQPELFSFEDQVAWFSGADVVVGLSGSGMFNVVFCNNQAKVITIEPKSTFLTSHTGLFASLNLWYGVIFGSPIDPSIDHVHSNWMVDTDAVIGLVRRAIQSP